MVHLRANRVEPRGFFYPLHAQPAFGGTEIDERSYPNAAAGHRQGVCLPLHSEMSIKDVARIAGVISEHQAALA
jgi:perosamine synthetase